MTTTLALALALELAAPLPPGGAARRSLAAGTPPVAAQASGASFWPRLVAALQLVAEEYFEALELESPEAAHQRHMQLSQLVGEMAREVPGDAALAAQLSALEQRLLGVDYRIGTDLRAVAQKVIEQRAVPRTPRATPDLARGRRVFAQACAACHGSDATGRSSPLAATMDPPPPDILHPQVNWSPYEMWNRVTFGGHETAMPAFDAGLSDSARWDVVFWLFAERWPSCTRALPPLSAGELAVLGDFELGNKFGYGAAACLRRAFLPPR